MTLEDLHSTVVDGFKRVDERLASNDERFDRMDERLDRMDQRLDAIEVRIREEGETTRRYFEVMVEKIEASVRIVAEGHGHLRTVVDDHEVRLQAIEKRV